MGWFKTEQEFEEIRIKQRKLNSVKPRRRVSKIEEEGEFVTIEIKSSLLPDLTFSEEEETVDEEENVSTIHISNISE